MKHRRSVETLHEETTVELVGGEVDWPAHEGGAPLAPPRLSSLKEGTSSLVCLRQTLKQAEETSTFMMVLIVGCIDNCRNTAYRFSSLLCQKELHLGVVEEWILARIEKRLAFENEGRDPVRITRIPASGPFRRSPRGSPRCAASSRRSIAA